MAVRNQWIGVQLFVPSPRGFSVIVTIREANVEDTKFQFQAEDGSGNKVKIKGVWDEK